MQEVPTNVAEFTAKQRQILEAVRVAIMTDSKLRAEAKRVTEDGLRYQKRMAALVARAGFDLVELGALEGGMVVGLVTNIGMGNDPKPLL